MDQPLSASRSPCWLAIRFPYFIFDALGKDIMSSPYAAVVVEHATGGLDRVCAINHVAKKNRIDLGLSVAIAQNIINDVQVFHRDKQKEEDLLQSISDQLYQLTPYIYTHLSTKEDASLYTSQELGVCLELSRCEKLFRGYENLKKRVVDTLNEYAVTYVLNFGSTMHASWLLSYLPEENTDYGCRAICHSLIGRLNLSMISGQYANEVSRLQGMGFQVFNDVIKQVEKDGLSSFRRRFSPEFIAYFQDLFDIENNFHQPSLFKTPHTEYVVEQSFSECVEFDYPVNNTEQLQPAVEHLLGLLSSELVCKQKQVQDLSWHLYDIHHNSADFSVQVGRMYQDITLAQKLTMIVLENKELPFGVDALELCCHHMLNVNFEKTTLNFNDQEKEISRSGDFAVMTAKLTSRLGSNSLYHVSYVDDLFPEKSFEKRVLMETVDENIQGEHAISPRPTWIFQQPTLIGRRQNSLYWQGTLHILHGPERIEGEWWGRDVARDYFVAKREDNARLWVFYDIRQQAWYVHGMFS